MRMRAIVAVLLLLVGLVPVPTLVLAVQQPAVSAPEQLGGDGYEPVSSLPAPAQEALPAAPMVMAAYGFVWLAVVVYLWSIWRRLGAVQRELDGVARRVD
ncbi:MAG: CcmD family protein, partial [Vicinamibacterales bacterium]|nr:CcmD family protein [Vicinamibacterales bacterium]